MYLTVHDHQGKARPLMQALQNEHEFVYAGADALLIDHDGPDYYKRIIETHNAPTVIYPHGGGVFPAWDGVWEPHEKTAAMMVWGEGQAEAMRTYGYPNPIHVVGWYLCERKPFRPFEGETLKVLFGPVHALNNGHLRKEYAQRNFQVYSRLLDKYNADEIELTVRHVGHITASNLFPAYGVNYTRAGTVDLVEQIDNHDLVVANGTMAMTALARGCPTVMFDEGLAYQDNGRTASHWSDYSEKIRYPHQFFGENWLTACNEPPVDYVERFLGPEFDGNRVTNILESIHA